MNIVMAYYNNPVMLAYHKAEWSLYTEPCNLILVDDGSAEPPDLSDCPLPYQHFRVLEDRPWHQNGARNLAMTHAEGWCLLTDMDHALTAEDLERAHAMAVEPRVAYKPRRVWPDGTDRDKRHPNSYLIHSADFWRAGGYDERYCGYYGTDATFRRQLLAAGVEIRKTNDFALTLYEGVIEDATTKLGRKGSEYHSARHPKVRARMKKPTMPTSWLNFPWERIA